ncbi:helix-turn-helix transcriptional regulator [Streptomyces caniscabiei]|uniref:WYL domain-containing protein n=1 Tax=Streptomyces caniscabiei TaxID=2746961 RepID=A0A927QNP3_9ACTN|nr:WYL domain-containing protein [Streptomyces caniscabiei]MBD9728127.1 WYL domain-containing protein [Streptomyces caniscabiei]MDX3513853.1 WYL domain-containing protein [Streptomyces caniscabiei]MDX3722855.1 WYL domain-containing protein [Streptomyces caniscabiei]MDX3731513.1 WYL domain-containing protein [Streptomyces caniscabiei]WEO23615.1 WYL domain-containing protein [Streptomyces caniscabiei]
MTPDRFFTLMLLLESRDAVTTQELASALGVSLRTITRDLNWLRDAGLPVTAHRGRLGGVTMLPGSGLDLTRLTPGERDHLSLTGLDERQRAELDASVESRRALSKIAAGRSRRVHELLPLTDVVHVDSRPWLRTRASGTTPAALIGSVRRGRRLRIEYDSPRESCPRDLVVDPYGLFAKAGIWYLVGDCARVPRLYRLERITTWNEVDQPRRIRENQTLATVAAALIDQWEHNHPTEVSATIDPTQIERARRIFGGRLVLDDQEASATGHKVTIRFAQLEDVRALLPFGSAITVHGPTEARAHLRALATDLARHYAPTPTA